MSLSKDDFLTPNVRHIEELALPIKGGTVRIRRLTVDEQIQREAEYSALDESDTKGYTVVSLAFYLSTEEGGQFVTIDEMRARLGLLDPTDIAAIMRRGNEINRGLAPAVVEAAAGN